MTYQMDGWQSPTLGEELARTGVKRRDFLKYCSWLAGIFAAGPALLNSDKAVAAEVIAETLESQEKPVVVWLQLQECTGCVESALRSGGTTVEEVVLRLLSVEYQEAVMWASGDGANAALKEANEKPHILVVNGSIPVGDDGIYCTIGGESAETVLRDAAKNAVAILAVGACSVWGGVQASYPNPTSARGVGDIIKDKPIVNVAGCPPIGEVITATVAYYLTHGTIPKLDAEGRPLFAYDQRIHDSCPRRAHFDAGQYVRYFDDEGARNGWCLYEVGCKGPSTFSACPIIQWNMHTSWPIGAGHPCIGCTEKEFFDKFTPFYQTLPNVGGLGIEATAEKVGWGLLGATVAGVGVHAGLTAIRHAAGKRAAEKAEPLAAFGDGKVLLPDPKRATGKAADEPEAAPKRAAEAGESEE
ncbi:MAG: hydrogenase small subunit [Propionibacteriaceae bacterium]|jgi:hydrogenase small subunit|nr:hydrogenase small subunit [Propionibacteriaceae bacterium]